MTIAQPIEDVDVKKGIQQGTQQTSVNMARQLIKQAVDITLSTGLDDTELKTLFNDLKLTSKKDTKTY